MRLERSFFVFIFMCIELFLFLLSLLSFLSLFNNSVQLWRNCCIKGVSFNSSLATDCLRSCRGVACATANDVKPPCQCTRGFSKTTQGEHIATLLPNIVGVLTVLSSTKFMYYQYIRSSHMPKFDPLTMSPHSGLEAGLLHWRIQ